MSRTWAVAVLGLLLSGSAFAQSASAPPILWILGLTDTLASGGTLSASRLARLPIDDPRHAFPLIPGVSLGGAAIGIDVVPTLRIRGAASPDIGVYVDGAPMRLQTLGGEGIGLAPNAVAELHITTGVTPVSVGAVGSGLVEYVTRGGVEKLTGEMRFDSDGPFGSGSTVGYNRIEGAGGGPLGALRFFLSGTLQGQRSSYRGVGAASIPFYLPADVDTVVSDPSGGSLTVPQFTSADGLHLPLDWSTARRFHGKVEYPYGKGSRFSLTAFGGDLQQRFFPGRLAGDPAMYQGRRAASTIGIIGWRHAFGNPVSAPLALDVNLSFARETDMNGPLTLSSEAATTDPSLGIAFQTLRFTGIDSFPLPVTEELVRNIRTNSGRRVPFPNRADLTLRQPFRINPYGMISGWPTSGVVGPLESLMERRTHGRATLSWTRGLHRIAAGLDAERTTVSVYSSNLITQAFMQVFLEHPQRVGFFANDRLNFADGSAVVDIGLRYDRFAPGGEFPRVPGRIYSSPIWSPNAATSDTAYNAAVGRVFTPTHTQNALSPRIRFGYSLSPSANVRFGYSSAVTPPPWGFFFRGVNSDLDFTNSSDFFGRDVRFARSSLFDIGGRFDLNRRIALDVSAYRKGLPNYVARIQPFADPLNPGDTLYLTVLTSTSRHDIIGLDGKLDWRAASWLSSSLVYSVQRAHTSFPGSTLGSEAEIGHAIAALVVVEAPSRGALTRDLSAAFLLRAMSGASYTRLINQGLGMITPGILPGRPAEPLGSSRLPWTKHIDLRITKAASVVDLQWELFIDIRNVLSFRNAVALFAETGAVTNDEFRTQLLAPEFANLRGEASANGALLSGDAVDLSSCGSWMAPPNCVMLRRTEQRFGDGDGIYTLAEQTNALHAYYEAFFGSWRFYEPGRTIRVGARLHR
jgi:hypothetical protein